MATARKCFAQINAAKLGGGLTMEATTPSTMKLLVCRAERNLFITNQGRENTARSNVFIEAERKVWAKMKSNIERYYMSLAPIQAMERNGLILHSEFLKAEDFLAQKYNLKKHNIYRSNDLIKTEKRVIDILPKKEAQNDTKKDNDNRCCTEIRKTD